ncbi:MAG TPA: hypothetical protein VHF26_05630 [Trebonia sp.]|nr:hypothetical protein [Trebonia sp.]
MQKPNRTTAAGQLRAALEGIPDRDYGTSHAGLRHKPARPARQAKTDTAPAAGTEAGS